MAWPRPYLADGRSPESPGRAEERLLMFSWVAPCPIPPLSRRVQTPFTTHMIFPLMSQPRLRLVAAIQAIRLSIVGLTRRLLSLRDYRRCPAPAAASALRVTSGMPAERHYAVRV